MFHKVKLVQPLDNYKLSVLFAEGVLKTYDVNPLFSEIPTFISLKNDILLFNSVHVDNGGYGISWNDDIDLSCDELWENGIDCNSPFKGFLAFSDATELWNLNESTLRKAINYGKFVPGLDVCKFGKQWVVTVAAMEREYGII